MEQCKFSPYFRLLHACVVRSTAIILWATHLDAVLALICMKPSVWDDTIYDACNHRRRGNFGLVKVSEKSVLHSRSSNSLYYVLEVSYRLSLRLHNKSYYGSVHVQIFGLRCKGAELNLMIILLRMILLGP